LPQIAFQLPILEVAHYGKFGAPGEKHMSTVLITGTSTGIGHVATELLAAKGWRVFATMRNLAKKDSL